VGAWRCTGGQFGFALAHALSEAGAGRVSTACAEYQ
jgi:hypothetical protein